MGSSTMSLTAPLAATACAAARRQVTMAVARARPAVCRSGGVLLVAAAAACAAASCLRAPSMSLLPTHCRPQGGRKAAHASRTGASRYGECGARSYAQAWRV